MTGEARRLFFAWMTPPEVGAEVARRVEELLGGDEARRRYRLPRAVGLHVTALFLGDVPGDAWLGTKDELATVVRGLPAPHLALERAGAFPNARKPRVLWLGLDAAGETTLRAWREPLVDWARARGFRGDDLARPFRPHLTVARPRGPGPVPEAFAESHWALPWEPGGLSLVESVPAERGPRCYEARFRVDSG